MKIQFVRRIHLPSSESSELKARNDVLIKCFSVIQNLDSKLACRPGRVLGLSIQIERPKNLEESGTQIIGTNFEIGVSSSRARKRN